MLPTPSAAFTIPSLYDGLELDCRLYFAHHKENGPGCQSSGCAIFAHPYAPLGGSYDDPILHLAGSALLREGYVLATFNFRGAHGSSGRTSWTGKGELGDYSSLLAFILCFLNAAGVSQHMRTNNQGNPSLILGGYSYGSLIASNLPSLDILLDIITVRKEGSAENEIWHRATELSKAFLGYCEAQSYCGRSHSLVGSNHSQTALSMGGSESPAESHHQGKESPKRSLDVERLKHSIEKVRNKLGSTRRSHEDKPSSQESYTSHDSYLVPELAILLVSPLLGTVSALTTMFTKLSFERHSSQLPPPEQSGNSSLLTSCPVLAIFGDKDAFTSSRKLKSWCVDLQSKSLAQLEYYEVQGAGHFWVEHEAQTQLTRTIIHWLREQLRTQSPALPEHPQILSADSLS